MTDYKPTLNLPNTPFAMKANLAQREPQMLKQWTEASLYQEIQAARAGAEKFVLHDGPPYANGNIHIGHAVNKILKDFIIKSKTLSGYQSPYIPGWDCHGLPIENNVEKKKGKAGVKISHQAFRAECRKYAAKQVAGQKADFIRLGVLADWDKPYLTMDFNTEADTVRALGKIAEQGHLVRGFKPVYWSVVGGSALAEAEVEYHDKTSTALDVRFPVVDKAAVAEIFGVDALAEKTSVVIWTTTAWTLPANQAVSFNAELEYALVAVDLGLGEEQIIIAADMVDAVMTRYGIKGGQESSGLEESVTQVLATAPGELFEKQLLQHPFYIDKNVPILLGDHVTTDAGTGAVHTAPDHGVDDFVVSKKYGIETLNYVGSNGVYSSQAPEVEGLHVYKVEPKVLELLEAQGNLVRQKKFEHSYPHCWRTKTPLIFRATPQWFISMTEKGLKDAALSAIDPEKPEGVEWIPDWGYPRIQGMLGQSPDWCVSRQRTWGVPITLFVHKETQELHPNTAEIFEQVAQKIEVEGMDAWFESETSDWLSGDDAADYEKITDTLDVWFDSGVTHYSVMKQRDELLPDGERADLYLEGSDQHRGWFQSSLKASMAINNEPPYKQVLTHGFTVDADGKKMSKSLGNVVSPQDICNKYGADILRLWVAATDYRTEMTVSDEIIKRVADSYRRIRNTARFLLANMPDFEPEQHAVAADDMLALDQWILRKASALQTEIIEAYDAYQFHNIYQKIHNFCAVDLGGFYLDIIKDRQYTLKTNSKARRSAQTALYHIVQAMSRWLAPLTSFTAQEIWNATPGQQPNTWVFSATWYDSFPEITTVSDLDDAFWSEVLAVKTEVNKALEQARKDKVIGASLQASVTLHVQSELKSLLEKLGDELRFVTITSEANLADFDAAQGQATELETLRIAVLKKDAEKCARCWHFREDVGQVAEHPELCLRCVDNIDGDGESRAFC